MPDDLGGPASRTPAREPRITALQLLKEVYPRDVTDRERLRGLYSKFPADRSINPTGWDSRLAFWRGAIQHLALAGVFSEAPPADGLLRPAVPPTKSTPAPGRRAAFWRAVSLTRPDLLQAGFEGALGEDAQAACAQVATELLARSDADLDPGLWPSAVAPGEPEATGPGGVASAHAPGPGGLSAAGGLWLPPPSLGSRLLVPGAPDSLAAYFLDAGARPLGMAVVLDELVAEGSLIPPEYLLQVAQASSDFLLRDADHHHKHAKGGGSSPLLQWPGALLARLLGHQSSPIGAHDAVKAAAGRAAAGRTTGHKAPVRSMLVSRSAARALGHAICQAHWYAYHVGQGDMAAARAVLSRSQAGRPAFGIDPSQLPAALAADGHTMTARLAYCRYARALGCVGRRLDFDLGLLQLAWDGLVTLELAAATTRNTPTTTAVVVTFLASPDAPDAGPVLHQPTAETRERLRHQSSQTAAAILEDLDAGLTLRASVHEALATCFEQEARRALAGPGSRARQLQPARMALRQRQAALSRAEACRSLGLNVLNSRQQLLGAVDLGSSFAALRDSSAVLRSVLGPGGADRALSAADDLVDQLQDLSLRGEEAAQSLALPGDAWPDDELAADLEAELAALLESEEEEDFFDALEGPMPTSTRAPAGGPVRTPSPPAKVLARRPCNNGRSSLNIINNNGSSLNIINNNGSSRSSNSRSNNNNNQHRRGPGLNKLASEHSHRRHGPHLHL
ncbi:hypothetical protein H696_02347 [Fonticula alba]|uniref:Uncharacterized protein n=1 Tax=Fonticula alba TaxID=691883 RepID=A0A058ZAJ4_FONAL|nr:hypothetical protein H696_02347 [Fonticula alba]KCV71400.1 hypothetical protein H696_02347 [Fonticula alba]|eukprot:XP_009494523.1 hypothetical protein H696_02347 [Fonticula alba]